MVKLLIKAVLYSCNKKHPVSYQIYVNKPMTPSVSRSSTWTDRVTRMAKLEYL